MRSNPSWHQFGNTSIHVIDDREGEMKSGIQGESGFDGFTGATGPDGLYGPESPDGTPWPRDVEWTPGMGWVDGVPGRIESEGR